MSNRLSISGTTLAVLICNQIDSLMSTRLPQVVVTFEGFVGEKHSGFTRPADSRTPYYTRGTPIRNDRQVTILSAEELAHSAANLGLLEILPEWIGANLLLSGIPHLSHLPPMTRLVFSSGAVLLVTAENHPCKLAGRTIAAQVGRPELGELYPKAAAGLRGVVAVVELPGLINEGDTVTVEIPRQVLYEVE
jgi:hypothetical protein